MEPITESILCSIVASIICDIGKCCLGQIKYKKVNFERISVQEYVSQKLDYKYEMLSDYGTIEEYLKFPIVRDTISNYVTYIVTGRLEEKLFNHGIIRRNKSQNIEESDIVNFLVENLMICYKRNKVMTIPEKTLIEGFFSDVFSLVATYILEQMNQEEVAMIYFVNSKMNILGNGLFSKLDDIMTILDKSINSEVINLDENFLEKKKYYIKILKDNHKMAHIYLLDKFEIDEFYVPPFLSYRNENGRYQDIRFRRASGLVVHRSISEKIDEELFADWRHIFERNNIVYVTGGAGYGKSLFMKKLIVEYEKLNVLDAADYLVIYGELKNFYLNDKDNPMSVLDFLKNSMKKETLIDDTILSYELINYYLKRGRCLVLLDALDEVDKTKRQKLHSLVINFFKNENPNNKICITSRARGFLPEKDIEVYEIEPLDSIQIKTYVDNIIKLGKFDKKDRNSFLQQTEILVNKGFLSSFLVLSLLINIYKAERELPENKLELYQKCFEYISNKREKEKSQDKYDWSLISTLMKDNTFMELSNLCLPNNSDVSKDAIIECLTNVYRRKYESENRTEQAIEQFLIFCSDRTELFVPSSGEDCFKFFHRSFFEYFYSQYIYTRMHNVEEIYNAWEKFDIDSEVFELTLAMFKQKDEIKYQEIVEYILEKISNERIERKDRIVALNILILCMQVIDDELYKMAFINFLITASVFCIKSINDIHNQKFIVEVISSKKEYCTLISKHYEERAKFEVIKEFVNIFPEIVQFIQQSKKRIEVESKLIQGRFQNYFKYNFYSKIYFKMNSLKLFLEELKSIDIEKIGSKCGISKKEINKMQSRLKKYLALDKQVKELVIKAICEM